MAYRASQRVKNLLEYGTSNPMSIDLNICQEYNPHPELANEMKAAQYEPSELPRSYAVGRCRRKRYAALDEHALNCPDSEAESMPALVRYLTQGARNTEERVRVLHRWICANISIVVESQGSGDRGSTAAESVFTSRTTVPQGYASLLGALCKEAEVECRVVSGVCKCLPGWSSLADHEHMPETNHKWNAVRLPEQDGWALVDCACSAGYIDESTQEFQACYEDAYFLTQPELLIIDHVPYDSQLTLLETPVTWTQFRKSLGNLRLGWLPDTYPQSEIYCASSTVKPTLFALEFKNFKGCHMKLKHSKLSCPSDPYTEMPPVKSLSGKKAMLEVTLPLITTLDPEETCTFILKTSLTVAQGQEEATTDSISYTVHAKVVPMDQHDPLWPGPPLPSPEVEAAFAEAAAAAARPRPPPDHQGSNGGPPGGEQEHRHGSPSGLPPGLLAAVTSSQKKPQKQEKGLGKIFSFLKF